MQSMWFKQSLVVILLLVSWGNIALAEESGNSDNLTMLGKKWRSDGIFILTSPLRMDSKDVKNLLLFSGVTYGLTTVDSKVTEEVSKPGYENLGKFVNPLGGKKIWAYLGVLTIGSMAVGDSRAKKTAALLVEASLFNAVLTGCFKEIAGRPRPFQVPEKEKDVRHFHPFSGLNAFPSGHTSSAFTAATVISNQYPSLWIKVPTYALASLVGFQRVYSHAHSLSDVFAGAVLGMWVGNTICSLDKKWDKGENKVSFDVIKIGYKF